MRRALLFLALEACVPPREPTPAPPSEPRETSVATTVDVDAPPRFVRGVDRELENLFWSGEPVPPGRVLSMHYDGLADDRLDNRCLALYELRRLDRIARSNDQQWAIETAQTHEPIAREYGFSELRAVASYFAEGRAGKTRFFEYGIVEKGGDRVERYERFVDHGGKLWHATLFIQGTAPASSIDVWLPLLFDAPFALSRPKERIALFGLPTRL